MGDDGVIQTDKAADDPSLSLDFLAVDEFLKTLVDARVLKTAFELGLIDRLVDRRSGSTEALGRAVGVDPQGMRFLVDLLGANRVTEERGGDLRLTRRFQTALRFRDLLEVKLDYVGFTINDFADLFTALVRDPSAFMGHARLFALFDYRRCFEFTPENYTLTRNWMRITSTLTRYDARACLRAFDFSRFRRMLDIGGNSGEFILQLCRHNPNLQGTVFDLPLVCEIGTEHVLAEPEHARISFISADIRREPVPFGFDLITFKSMLHDWPADDSRQFIDKAVRALEPGGTLLIFERAKLEIGDTTPPMAMIPNLLFFRSYRLASDYEDQMRALGMQDVGHRVVELDSPYFIVSGRKP